MKENNAHESAHDFFVNKPWRERNWTKKSNHHQLFAVQLRPDHFRHGLFLYSKPFISRQTQTIPKEECDNNYDESMFEDALKEVWPELYQQLKNIEGAESILECLIALRTAIHLLEVYDKGGREALEALRFGKS